MSERLDRPRLPLPLACGAAFTMLTLAHAQLAPAPSLPPSSITLRSGEPSPAYEVRGLSDQGVKVRTATIPERIIAWDRVESIEGPLAAEAKAYLPLAETAWRARVRLERGDAAAAEVLYEDLFKASAGQSGPTAAAIAEGLLRCRLRRGAQAAAVGAYLAWFEAAAPLQDYVHALNARDIPECPIFVDPATGLLPALPPIWINTPSTQAFARGDLLPKDPKTSQIVLSTDSPAGQLATLYRRAALFEAGQSLPELPDALRHPQHPAVLLVAHIVLARTGDAQERPIARAALLAMLSPSTPAWQEAWIRVALGRSLLRESNTDDQLLALAQMLHLPARLSRINPYLTGLALAESAVAALRHNDTAGAVKLRQLLVDRFPAHPALDWEPIRGWTVQALPDPRPDEGPRLESLPTPSGENPSTSTNK